MRMKWKCMMMSGLAVLLMLGLSGCGKKRPVNLGEADITALGLGVGRELRDTLGQGDTVLVFGIPQARANAELLEAAVVRGLENQLKDQGVRVERVQYTDQEFDAYMNGRHETLHPNYAGGAMDRYRDRSPRAIVSLVGWPDTQATFLPRDITFVGVSWSWAEDPRPWLTMFDRVIVINSLHGPISGRPSRNALRRPEEVLEWFDERFEIRKGGA